MPSEAFFCLATLKFDGLTAFGLAAVALMLLFYALEDRSPAFVLAFAASCVLGSAYGFLQGAWPFGLVEGVWSGVAAWRWWGQISGNRPPRGRDDDGDWGGHPGPRRPRSRPKATRRL